MSKEDEYRDQAESLRQRVKELNSTTYHTAENMDPLPPREQIHRNKKNKMKWKVKYPVIRLLVLFFFLLPVIIFSVIFYRDGHKIPNTVKTSGDHVGYETVNLEPTKEKEKKIKNQKQSENTKVNGENESSKTQSETVTPNKNEVTNQASFVGGSDKNSTPQKVVPKPQSKPAPQQTSKVIYHTVKAKETLFGIAMKYYQSQTGMDIIKKANQLQGDQLTEGQVLKIPLNQ